VTGRDACSVLMYLPTGNPLGLRTATVRGRTCRVSAAPPGAALQMEQFKLKGGAVVLSWRGREVPIISSTSDIDEVETTFRHADFDVSVAVVSNDQDLLPPVVFDVLADALATKVGRSAPIRAVEPWFRCLGESMAESAAILLAALQVPAFA
jgi:hypothetical protein